MSRRSFLWRGTRGCGGWKRLHAELGRPHEVPAISLVLKSIGDGLETALCVTDDRAHGEWSGVQ